MNKLCKDDIVLGFIRNMMNNLLKEIKSFLKLQPLESGILLLLIAIRIREWCIYGFQSSSFHGIFNNIPAVIATLYIAPVIAMYRLCKESTFFLIKKYIEDQYFHYKTLRIAVLAVISLNSHLYYQILVTLVLLWELFYISLLLNDSISENLSDKALKYFAKLIGKQSRLTKVIETMQSIKKELPWLSEEILYDLYKIQNMQTACFGPVKPVSVKKEKFKRFLEHVRDELNPNRQGKEITLPYDFNFEVEFSIDGKELFVTIYHNSKEKLRKEDEFNREFEQCFEEISPRDIETINAFEKYINELAPNILYLIEQNNFPRVRKELDQIVSILDKIKEVKPQNTDMNRLIFSVRDIVSYAAKFKQSKAPLEGELFKFCIKLFETCVYSKNNQYMGNMLGLIIECFEADIFKGSGDDKSDLKAFEQEVTSVIKYGKPTDNFLISYIQTLNKFVKENMGVAKNDKLFDRFNFATSLLHNLSDDLKENRLYNITTEHKLDVTKYLQKTFIFLAALFERDKASDRIKKRYDSVENFINRIRSDSLMENLHELCQHRLREFDPVYDARSQFRPEPNRHGSSSFPMMGSYNPSELYSAFLKKYMDCNPEFLKQVKKDEIRKYYTLKPLFKALLEKIDDAHKSSINDLIKLCDKVETEKIIKASLSEGKIKEFRNNLHKTYKDTERISKYCKPNYELQNVEKFLKMKESRLGMRRVTLKECFIDKPSCSVIIRRQISSNIGRNIGRYENHTIFNQLCENLKNNNESNYKQLNRNNFDSEKILHKWKGKGNSYIILNNDNLYTFSNIKNIPDIHYINWNKSIDPRCFYMLIKKDDIHLDFILWKNDPHYPEHKLERHERISYKITDLAKDEEFRKDISSKNPNLSKDNLESKVLTAIYFCSKVNTKKSDFSNIEIVELIKQPQTQ